MCYVKLPNGETKQSAVLSAVGDLYQVSDGKCFSLWDSEGNMMYEGDSYLSEPEKYIMFAKRADNDPK